MAEPMDVAAAAAAPAPAPADVDEGLYSRQLYVMGHEAQRRMASSDVLIVGLNGLGVEVAKNVILAGVKSLTLYDPTPASYGDLSAQFYLTEADLGQPRAAASKAKLAELNEYVQVSLTPEGQALDGAYLSGFRVVVAIDQLLAEQLRLNDLCRECGACFLAGDVRGVAAAIFCDFGASFTCYDVDGEPAASAMISAVTQENPAAVTCLEDHRHGLETGDFVTITGVEGMEELNGQEFQITVTGPYTFELPTVDATGYANYIRGGYVNQVKKPVELSFRTMREALVSPGEFLLADFAKMDRPPVLHQAFRGLHAYMREHGGALPPPGDAAAAEEVWQEAQRINAAAKTDGDGSEAALHVENFEDAKDVVLRVALVAAGVTSPMCAAMGGVLGQEVLKAASGKFCPIRQWFYIDALETLSDEPLPAEEVAPRGSRYDGQIAVYGATLQTKICAQRVFLVGAGAIGCEMLKNWAMMGVGCGDAGGVHVTDMDRIERSNLSRQFLFRSTDIGQPKSTTAAASAKRMNTDMRVSPYEAKVAPSTEDVFDTDFYDGLDAVCTALDNIDARLYMDSRCLFFGLPMYESGTMGTKGNTQIVVPHLTEHYGATRDPPEKSVPVCTLKNFPHQIEHTIQWARDWFEGAFKQTPDSVNAYLSDAEFLKKLERQPNIRLETLTAVMRSLVGDRPRSFDDCVAWARLQFDKLFRNAILQLLHNFPLDHVTTSGAPFWSTLTPVLNPTLTLTRTRTLIRTRT
uniref:E1 ubiquitin-activating enzyme n=1 Tax=Phaeomonas parva TaxID=124430 RepID=A0A7S1XMG5_9STRA|mmetsp:Transcript_21826/g.66910  ORF Transcript_21826/g.66910 Transcript_21826/m.66910 type:complete len:749 (+) Transcript_21826:33-2279(+)